MRSSLARGSSHSPTAAGAPMQPTPRDQLPYTDADVSTATDRLHEICDALPEVSTRISHGV